MTIALASISPQAAVEPIRPWDAAVSAIESFMLRVLGLPAQASTIAPDIDRLHFFQITVMFAVAALIGVAVIFFVIRFRRRGDDQVGRRVSPPLVVELGIYAAMLALFMVFWVIGFGQFSRLDLAPEDSLDVYVTSRQWVWQFAHWPAGPSSTGVLYVPAGRPVRLLITSRDVIHSFSVPEFRIKRDAVPGRYNSIWFEATMPGRYPILCAELCGVGHSRMRSEVVVLRPEEFDAWLDGRPPADPLTPMGYAPGEDDSSDPERLSGLAEAGRVAATRHGCVQCHSADGTPRDGPTWRNLWGAWETMSTGELVHVDAGYVTESMMDPEARVVAGFEPIMPSFQGRITPAETAAVIEYMKAISPAPGLRPVRGSPTAGAVAGGPGRPIAEPGP